MKQLLAAAAILSCLAVPATATEWVNCGDGEGKVSFDVLMGLMDVIAIDTVGSRSTAKTGWSNKPRLVRPRLDHHGAGLRKPPDQMWIDVIDEGMGGFVAKLRLFKASETVEGSEDGVFDATGGTLQMPGIGAWVVGCSGP